MSTFTPSAQFPSAEGILSVAPRERQKLGIGSSRSCYRGFNIPFRIFFTIELDCNCGTNAEFHGEVLGFFRKDFIESPKSLPDGENQIEARKRRGG
jgi:hypothetical protein